jgi:hypothetical protein
MKRLLNGWIPVAVGVAGILACGSLNAKTVLRAGDLIKVDFPSALGAVTAVPEPSLGALASLGGVSLALLLYRRCRY